MAIILRYQLPRFLERAVATTVTADVRDTDDNSEQTPASGTYSLYHGSRVLIDAQDITTGPPGSYAVLAADVPATESLSDNLQERWAIVLSGITHTLIRQVYLVRFVPKEVITDLDVAAGHTQLARLRDDDEADFSRQRDEAWVWIQRELISRGRRPDLVLDSSALRDAHIFRTRFELFRDYASSTTTDQRYQKLADDYETRAQLAMDTVPTRYDSDEDGFDDDGPAVGLTPTLSINRPPRWG